MVDTASRGLVVYKFGGDTLQIQAIGCVPDCCLFLLLSLSLSGSSPLPPLPPSPPPPPFPPRPPPLPHPAY